MYFEQIGEYTKTHLMEHLGTYLAEQQLLMGDQIPLVMPKHIDVSSLIGGIVQVARETLPQYAIDVIGKNVSASFDTLYNYDYQGQIVMLVGGGASYEVDKLVKRHAAAVEKYVKSHRHLHQYEDLEADFSITSWQWQSITFTGAMELEREDSPVGPLWVAGAALDLIWTTSEMGSEDHVT